MGFRPIHPFIHEYDFPFDAEFTEHRDEIIRQFNEKIDSSNKNNRQNYTVIYDNIELQNKVQARFDKIINENYAVSPRIRPTTLNIYLQNNEHSANLWHDHVLTSTINGVIYFNLPKSGGGFEFNYQGDISQLMPQEGKIYLFPYWLLHRPLPQEDEDYRFCINLEYLCQARPMHNIQVPWYDPDQPINIVW